MAHKNYTTIGIDPTISAALDARQRGETRTARCGYDLTAYYALLDEGLRRARRILSPAEAGLILDVFNGTAPGQVWTDDRLIMRVRDAVSLDGMAEKWGVDGDILENRLLSIGSLAAIALADWAEQVWRKKAGDCDVATETAIFRG